MRRSANQPVEATESPARAWSPAERARSERLAIILVGAAVPRVWAAAWDQGIFWPDEIYQSLEPAHHFAFGYGFVAWEFQTGARSWVLPGLLGLFWKLLSGIGVDDALTLVISAKLLMVAAALAGIYAAMRVAEKLGGAAAMVLCGALAAAMASRTAGASFDDFGQRYGLTGSHPLWHRMEAVNRLLWSAGTQPDLCGLSLVGSHPIWTGGYTYLHRDVPILSGMPSDQSTNYLLAEPPHALPAGYEVVDRVADATLARRPGPCTPPPASFTRLFER